MKGRRIFVTGGAGVIGTALVHRLLAEGAILYVADLRPCPDAWQGKVLYRQGDLNALSPHELEAFSPEIVFHLAATFERSHESPSFFEANYRHNIQLSHHLLTVLKKVPSLKRFIFASSYLIYDPTLYLHHVSTSTPLALSEASRLLPRNLCGAAKFLCEQELAFLSATQSWPCAYVAARIFRVYGRGARDVIGRWLLAALRGDPLNVYGAEGQFDYIFADDVAEGLILLAQSSFSGVINLGAGKARRVSDILDVIKGHFPGLQVCEGAAPSLYEASVADISLLEEVTGWRPKHTLKMAIPLIIEFEKYRIEREYGSHRSILVSSIAKKVPLLHAVRAAAEKTGQFHRLVGSDSDGGVLGSYFVDRFWQCPTQDALTIEALLMYCKAEHIRAIIPTRDGELSFFARNRLRLEGEGIAVMVCSIAAIELCRDKLAFFDFLSAEGLPVIPTSKVIEGVQGERYVVKERFGAGAAHIGLDLSPKEAVAHAAALQQPLFQPYCQGREWSVDLYRSRQKKVIGTVARRRDVIAAGEAQVTTTALTPPLEELCCCLAASLDIEGHAVIQVIEDFDNSFHIVECNPRFGGASTASIAVGLDSFYWFLLEAQGYKLDERAFFRSVSELRQIRYPADLVIPWS